MAEPRRPEIPYAVVGDQRMAKMTGAKVTEKSPDPDEALNFRGYFMDCHGGTPSITFCLGALPFPSAELTEPPRDPPPLFTPSLLR